MLKARQRAINKLYHQVPDFQNEPKAYRELMTKIKTFTEFGWTAMLLLS